MVAPRFQLKALHRHHAHHIAFHDILVQFGALGDIGLHFQQMIGLGAVIHQRQIDSSAAGGWHE